MKDTVITLTAQTKRRELVILLCCFVAANLVNLFAIIGYGTRWIELLSQIGYVVFVTFVLYVAQLLVRWAVCGLFCRKR